MYNEIKYWATWLWGLCTAIIVLSVNGILPGSPVTLIAYYGVIVTAPICITLVIMQWVTKKPVPATWLGLAFGLGFVITFIFALNILWRFYTKESTAGSIESLLLSPIPYLSLVVIYLCYRAAKTKFSR